MDLRERTGSVQELSKRMVDLEISCSRSRRLVALVSSCLRAMPSNSFLRDVGRNVQLPSKKSGYRMSEAMDRLAREVMLLFL